MLSFRAVFSIEFYFGRLPQMAAIKKIVQLLPISSVLCQVFFVLVLTSTNHKARNRYPEMIIARNGQYSAYVIPQYYSRRARSAPVLRRPCVLLAVCKLCSKQTCYFKITKYFYDESEFIVAFRGQSLVS